VQAICREYNLPYHTGPFWKQTLSTWKRIFRLSLPSRTAEPLPA
jgi:linoleoyl-CoA desaturase